jgi:hypothetical protein
MIHEFRSTFIFYRIGSDVPLILSLPFNRTSYKKL